MNIWTIPIRTINILNTKITHKQQQQHAGQQQRLSTADADESWTGSKDMVFLPVLTAETVTLWKHSHLSILVKWGKQNYSVLVKVVELARSSTIGCHILFTNCDSLSEWHP